MKKLIVSVVYKSVSIYSSQKYKINKKLEQKKIIWRKNIRIEYSRRWWMILHCLLPVAVFASVLVSDVSLECLWMNDDVWRGEEESWSSGRNGEYLMSAIRSMILKQKTGKRGGGIFFPPSSRSINFLLAIWQEDRVCCGMFFKLFPSREYLVQNLARYFPFRFVSAKRYLAEWIKISQNQSPTVASYYYL